MTSYNYTKSIQSFYQKNPDLICGLLTSGFFSTSEKLRLINNLTGGPYNANIIDIGCGTGNMVRILEEYSVTSYLGMDILSQNITKARDLYPHHKFEQCDIHEYDNSGLIQKADLIFMLDVFEHLYDPEIVLAKCNMYLKPGGLLIISIPNYFNFAGLMKFYHEKFGTYRKDTWAPFSNCKPQEQESFTSSFALKRMLIKNGFNIKYEQGWDIVASFWPFLYGENDLRGFWKKHSGLYSKINRFFFAKNTYKLFQMYYIVSCQKL